MLELLSPDTHVYSKKNGKNERKFRVRKTIAGEGAILLLLSLNPYIGLALGIIGVVPLLRAMKEFLNYYQDETMYKNSLKGVKFYIIAVAAATVAIPATTFFFL